MIGAIVASGDLKAQQLGIYTNYMLNDYYYNPAVVGAKDVAIANISYRDQWAGFTDAPRSYMASVYGSIKNKRKVGLGANVIGDRAGLLQRTGGYFTYAYHFDLTKTLRLGLGLSAGYMQYRIRMYDARALDGGDVYLTNNVVSSGAFDANSGFYLYSNKFFFGVSGNQLLNYRLTISNIKSDSRLKPHMYVLGGYNFEFGSGKVKKNELQPSFLVRSATSSATIQEDLSLKYTYNKMFWLGLTYRTESAFCALLGFNYKGRFNVAYAYDYALSKINKYSVGSHEFWLSYTITKKKRSLSEEEEALEQSMEQLYKEQQEKEQNNNGNDENK